MQLHVGKSGWEKRNVKKLKLFAKNRHEQLDLQLERVLWSYCFLRMIHSKFLFHLQGIDFQISKLINTYEKQKTILPPDIHFTVVALQNLCNELNHEMRFLMPHADQSSKSQLQAMRRCLIIRLTKNGTGLPAMKLICALGNNLKIMANSHFEICRQQQQLR